MKRKTQIKTNNNPLEMKKNISNKITESILSEYGQKKSTWDCEGTVYIKQFNNPKPSQNLLSFDFDDTLCIYVTKVDKKNPVKTQFDKAIMEKKIKEYLDKDYTLCLFSNQKGVTTGNATLEGVQEKIEIFFTKELVIPITCIFSTIDDIYRKPYIGMLELFEEKYNGGLKINKNNSFYIGDCAGRKKNNLRKKNDYSDSDYKFALNAGINFQIPELFFLGKDEEIPKIELNLHQYDNNNNEHIIYPNEPEMIILIGSPGSGKSTFAEKVVSEHSNYIRISRDDLKTEKKCIQVAEANIKEKKSVIIDCTNPGIDKRKVYVELAKKNKITVRAFVLDISKEMAFHLNTIRKINKERKNYSEAVNAIPIHTFFKYYQKPTKEEGFDDIVVVNFVPGPFVNEKDKALFYMYSFN